MLHQVLEAMCDDRHYCSHPGCTPCCRFVEVPAPVETVELEKGVLLDVDFCLNKSLNGQYREPYFLVPLSDIKPKHPGKASKADEIFSSIQAKDAKTMDKVPKPVLQTLLIERFGQPRDEVMKLCMKKLIVSAQVCQFAYDKLSGLQSLSLAFGSAVDILSTKEDNIVWCHQPPDCSNLPESLDALG